MQTLLRSFSYGILRAIYVYCALAPTHVLASQSIINKSCAGVLGTGSNLVTLQACLIRKQLDFSLSADVLLEVHNNTSANVIANISCEILYKPSGDFKNKEVDFGTISVDLEPSKTSDENIMLSGLNWDEINSWKALSNVTCEWSASAREKPPSKKAVPENSNKASVMNDVNSSNCRCMEWYPSGSCRITWCSGEKGILAPGKLQEDETKKSGSNPECLKSTLSGQQHCINNDSVSVEVFNGCGEDKTVKACIQRRDGRQACGKMLIKRQKSETWWACKATTNFQITVVED